MSAPVRLARLLADGEVHSGPALAAALGLTRSAVWKQARALRRLGLVVTCLRGRGYRLAAPLRPLNVGTIGAQLRAGGSRLGPLALHDVVDSTSSTAAAAGPGAVCLAEHQRAGRGRRGRTWLSPYGVNLYFSVCWRYDCSPALLAGLSVALGIALARALRALGPRVAVKWPNDLVFRDRKLGGILVEVAGDAEGPCTVVVGIGINVNMRALDGDIGQPWTSLALETGREWDRDLLAAQLLVAVEGVLGAFPHPGLDAYRAHWPGLDALAGRVVSARWAGEHLEGTARGLDGRGGLRLETAAGPRVLSGGEVSVRTDGPPD